MSRLEFNFDPRTTIKRLRHHTYTWRGEGQYIVLASVAICNLIVIPGMQAPLMIIAGYTLLVLIPFTSQFFFPATPILSWVLHYFSSKYTIHTLRPHIWVSVLPTLESVLYGANISDILTRYTSPALDILAWIPYGVMHFSFPFVTAALIWVFGPPGAVKFFAKVFGWMNVAGVTIQVLFPCAPPWYELLHGMIPADYSMKGSPGGLARIDALFGGNGYTNTFTNSPMPFGAFPSLHAGCSTTDALLLNHFFPKYRVLYVIYVLWLYWSTMYLTHHYLIDLVAGAGLAIGSFYFFLNADPWMRDWGLSRLPGTQNATSASAPGARLGSTFAFPGAADNSMNGVEDTELGYKALPPASGGPEDYELPIAKHTAAEKGGVMSDGVPSRAVSPAPTPSSSAYATPDTSTYSSPVPQRRLQTSSSLAAIDALNSPRAAPPTFPTLSGASTPSRAGARSPARMSGLSALTSSSATSTPSHSARGSLSVPSDAMSDGGSSASSRQNPFLSTAGTPDESMSRPRTPRPSANT